MTLRIGEIKQLDSPDVLLLDYDDVPLCESRKQYDDIKNSLEFLRIGWVSIKLEASPSGNGIHGVVVLKEDAPLLYRICLQLILGSDRKREAINFHRAGFVTEETRTGYENILYSRKESVIINHGNQNSDTSGSRIAINTEGR